LPAIFAASEFVETVTPAHPAKTHTAAIIKTHRNAIFFISNPPFESSLVMSRTLMPRLSAHLFFSFFFRFRRLSLSAWAFSLTAFPFIVP
jgi:hypothetical protein